MYDTPHQSDRTTRNIVLQMLIREQGRSHLLERCDLKATSPHRWKSTCVNPNTKTHRASFRILLLAPSSFFFFATPHLLWFPDLQKEVGNLTTPPPWPDKSGCPSSHQTHLGHRCEGLVSLVLTREVGQKGNAAHLEQQEEEILSDDKMENEHQIIMANVAVDQYNRCLKEKSHHSPGNSVDAVPSQAVSRDQGHTGHLKKKNTCHLKKKKQW